MVSKYGKHCLCAIWTLRWIGVTLKWILGKCQICPDLDCSLFYHLRMSQPFHFFSINCIKLQCVCTMVNPVLGLEVVLICYVRDLWRLLRNRVSAQQARERKKAYLTDLEVKVKELEKKNSEMEERFSTLQNENQMLRQVHFILHWFCYGFGTYKFVHCLIIYHLVKFVLYLLCFIDHGHYNVVFILHILMYHQNWNHCLIFATFILLLL